MPTLPVLASCALSLLALAGCAQRWEKPGAAEGDFKVAEIRCEAAGLERARYSNLSGGIAAIHSAWRL